MPNPDEAREQARWDFIGRAYANGSESEHRCRECNARYGEQHRLNEKRQPCGTDDLLRLAHAWVNATSQYDQQRIAALVGALRAVHRHARVALENGFSFNREIIEEAERALAGQTERDEVPE